MAHPDGHGGGGARGHEAKQEEEEDGTTKMCQSGPSFRVASLELAPSSCDPKDQGRAGGGPAPARRSLVLLLGGASLAGLASTCPASASRAAETGYKRSPRGVPYEDLSGEGAAAGADASSRPQKVEAGDEIVVDYTLRRSNGYFIFSTVEGVSFQPLDVPAEPFRFVVGDDARVIPGLSDVVLGMVKGRSP